MRLFLKLGLLMAIFALAGCQKAAPPPPATTTPSDSKPDSERMPPPGAEYPAERRAQGHAKKRAKPRSVETVGVEPGATRLPAPASPPVFKEKAKPKAAAGLSIQWNAWTDEDGVPFTPVSLLRPHRDYVLNLDLATISYLKSNSNAASKPVSAGLETQISQWLAENPNRQSAIIKILILPDPVYFEPGRKRFEKLTIQLNKFRGPAVLFPGDPFEAMRKQIDLPFVLGHVDFDLHPMKPGLGAVGVSFWVDDRPWMNFP